MQKFYTGNRFSTAPNEWPPFRFKCPETRRFRFYTCACVDYGNNGTDNIICIILQGIRVDGTDDQDRTTCMAVGRPVIIIMDTCTNNISDENVVFTLV